MQDNVGTIVIGTKVDNRGLQRDLKQTEKIMQDASEQVFKDFGEGNFDIKFNKKNIDKEINKTRNFINKKFKESQVDFIDLKFPELKDRNIKPIIDINEENYKQIIKEEKAKQRMVSLEEKISSGKGRATQIQEEIDKLREESAELSKNYELWLELENRVQSGGALEPHELPFYEKYMGADEKIAKIEEKATDLEKKHSDINEKVRQYTNDLKVAEIEFSNINNISQQQEKAILKSDDAFTKINENTNKIGKTFSGVLKKIGKIALALVGVQTIMSVITRSFNTLTQYNEELGTKMEQMRLVLAVAFEPVVNWLINALHVILSLVNQIYSAIFGINLFGRASELWSKKMAKNLGGASSSAKELKKQLAGFDEMNVLQDPSASSGGGGAGGGGITPWTLEPTFDWGKIDVGQIVEKAKEIVGKLISGLNTWLQNVDPKELADGISKIVIGLLDIATMTFRDFDWEKFGKVLIEVLTNLDWPGIIRALLENILYSLIWPIDLLLGLIDGLVEFFESPDCLDKMIEAGKELVTGLIKGLITLNVKIAELGVKLIVAVVKIVVELAQRIWEKIKEYAPQIWEWLKGKFNDAIDWIKAIIQFIKDWINLKVGEMQKKYYEFIQKIKDKIDEVKQWITDKIENIKTGLHNAVEWIKDKFNSVTNFFKEIGVKIGDFFSGAIKGAVNGALSWIESKVNWFIDKINGVIGWVNNLPIGVHISKLSRISLPRLAVGGIINQPGRGVPVGGAIAGESGREGILPLTDRQAMAELGKEIGKWININATIPVNIGNRQVARVIQEINNDREFAMNS